ncbi:hypothetical protein VOLCADRAFT_116030 [Volvox carteri f. nagariensis]|uniref:Ancillary SecYEG translocon subunit/Cell division coordinator CpoB TPR domain-containing protein n=1 Tax=Volvox carteri f. nagariensis TaxID=3068 RepID=D8TJI1_VOLCA|nr:uncharacterized protein VOLCADRAFT_116030 [Volvox carteri f. nagariensis]EFJ52545.1 hypothetical protein VOLCADRAFT_116030 [Volvox carteri f. nagariensis]|eukprot:XP_002946618.1 hypothetical protein VOLCADRAFT_116030 [Volvox carteri f. nagariensis]
MLQVIKIGEGNSVSDLRDACWEALTAWHPDIAASGPGTLRLTGANRRPLSVSSCIADVLTNGDDVFFEVSASAVQAARSSATPSSRQSNSGTSPGRAAMCDAPTAAAATSSAKGGMPTSVASQPLASGQIASPQADEVAAPSSRAAVQAEGQHRAIHVAATEQIRTIGGSTPSGPSTGQATSNDSSRTCEALVPVVRALWLQAEELVAQLHYRGAGDILQQALLLVPEPTSPAHVATLVRLARMWLSAGNPKAAVLWALRAAKQSPGDPEVLELAGDCLREGGRPREAAAQYQSALEALQEGNGEENGAVKGTTDQVSAASGALLRLRLSLAACLAAVPGSSISPPYNNQDLAASLVMAVLERDPGHWEALRLYARIALDRGLREDALKVALRLVVGQPKHRGAKALLSECLPDEASCQPLYDELGIAFPVQTPPEASEAAPNGTLSSSTCSSSTNNSSSTAAALAFVATAVKDFGKVDTCIALLQRAVQLDPANPSYCLNLVHALELRQDLQAALDAGRSYCRHCGSHLAGRPLRDVDALLPSLPELRNPLQTVWYSSQPLWGSAVYAQGHGPDPPTERKEGGCRYCSRRPLSTGQGKVSYSSDQLDELALLFTLAKVLFVGGALTAAARLCDLVEPMRRASAVELHTTLIRNEAAYFGCVMQLLKDYPPPPAWPAQLPHTRLPPQAAADTSAGAGGASASGSSPSPLYLCGDSHCLSAAWRLVNLRGQQRLLRPLLVTGCKVWHLRPSSEFYPKKQFEVTLQLLPDGAQVVLVLGEIDCREGLLLAVQKGKYGSIAEGIDATVAIYMEVLGRMVSERSMEVFVHPVPPVLNETRGVVTLFTAALRNAVTAARNANPTLRQRLHYLDFFNQLLVPRRSAAGASVCATGSSSEPGATGGAVGGLSSSSDEVSREAFADGRPRGEENSGAVAARDDADGSGTAHTGVVGGAAVEGSAAAPAAAAAAGMGLRPDLAFDGTHLAPTYVTELDAALSGVP